MKYSIIDFYNEGRILWGLNKGGNILTVKTEKLKDICIPIIAVQGAAVFLCLLIVFMAGSFLYYHQTTQNAASAGTAAM